jgi:hypothetical protein
MGNSEILKGVNRWRTPFFERCVAWGGTRAWKIRLKLFQVVGGKEVGGTGEERNPKPQTRNPNPKP